jgi:hypothetical protein
MQPCYDPGHSGLLQRSCNRRSSWRGPPALAIRSPMILSSVEPTCATVELPHPVRIILGVLHEAAMHVTHGPHASLAAEPNRPVVTPLQLPGFVARSSTSSRRARRPIRRLFDVEDVRTRRNSTHRVREHDWSCCGSARGGGWGRTRRSRPAAPSRGRRRLLPDALRNVSVAARQPNTWETRALRGAGRGSFQGNVIRTSCSHMAVRLRGAAVARPIRHSRAPSGHRPFGRRRLP